MLKRVLGLCFAIVFLVSLSGCATARKQKELEIQGLRNQVSVLESQIQSKDEEINSLKEQLAKTTTTEEKQAITVRHAKKRVIGEVKSRPNIKEIQIALKNAGYEPGTIDGKMGKQTRDAVIAFQKAHNLRANGKVGHKTWNLLKEYLYKKLK